MALLLVQLSGRPQPGHFLTTTRARNAWSRERRAATRLLAVAWPSLSRDARQLALLAARGRWAEAISNPESSAPGVSGRALARLALDSADPALLPLLETSLLSGGSEDASAAATALLGLTMRVASEADLALLEGAAPPGVLDPEPPIWTAEDLGALFRAVARSVETFDTHRRKEVLPAALLLLGDSPAGRSRDALAALVQSDEKKNAESKGLDAVRAAIRRGRNPLARLRAWTWLRHEPLAAACLERLQHAWSEGDHEAVLRAGHLVLAPARAARAGLIHASTVPAPAGESPPGFPPARRLHATGPAPGPVVVRQLSAPARRHLPRFLAAIGHKHDSLRTGLDRLLLDPDPVVRLAALRAAEGDQLTDFCFDASPAIAASAAARLSSAGIPESGRLRSADFHRLRFLDRLARSPHSRVRQVAAQDHDRLNPGAHQPLRRLAARRQAALDPGAFASRVRDAVRESPEQGVEALMICRRIGMVAAVEPVVLGLVRDSLKTPDVAAARLAATAVACLGDLRRARASSLLRECMASHPDARVRSNAAEALARANRREHIEALDTAMQDEHHRVRGSGVRELLRLEPKPGTEANARAADTLAALLGDARAPHRLAGVWALHRSLRPAEGFGIGPRWERLAARTRWLADEDPDEAIRRRAGDVTRRLDALRFGPRPSPEVSA